MFFDPNGKLIADLDHSDAEDRFVILGLSKMPRLLVVCIVTQNNNGKESNSKRNQVLWRAIT